MVVKSELEKLGLQYTTVELGEAEIKEEISAEQLDRLGIALKKSGLELMDDNKSILVEKIKALMPKDTEGYSSVNLFRYRIAQMCE